MERRLGFLKHWLRCCGRAIARVYRFFRSHDVLSLCALLGIGLALIALIILDLFGASAWQEARVATAIGLLGTVFGLFYPIVSDRAKKKEEQKQEEQKRLDARFAAFDTRLDLAEQRLATHTHPDLSLAIKEVFTIAISNKVNLEASYKFDETKQQVREIKKKLEEYDQQ